MLPWGTLLLWFWLCGFGPGPVVLALAPLSSLAPPLLARALISLALQLRLWFLLWLCGSAALAHWFWLWLWPPLLALALLLLAISLIVMAQLLWL